MIDRRKSLVWAVWALVLTVGPATAWAGGGQLYDWSAEQAPVMVETDGGLIFLGTDKEPWRAYQWERAEGDKKKSLFVVDMNNDGESEVVAGGKPTFALHGSSNPAWIIEKGCDQTIVAQFAASDNLDVMCQRGSKIAIYTHDRQKIWSIDMGVDIAWCRAGDYNGDLQNDLECKYSGRGTFVRLDSEGKLLAKESKKEKLSGHEVELEETQPVGSAIMKGEKEFDLNGDGATEESLLADGSALVIQSRSKDKAVARTELGGEIQSALVKDLDGKGGLEIVALTDSEIAVLDAGGKKLGAYSAKADAYERFPVAKLDSLYARKFTDKKKAQKAVRDAQDQLAKCYERRVQGSLVVGVGQVILKVYVDKKGEVARIERMHSEIQDDEVEDCAKDVLKGLDYPKPKKGEDGKAKEATVNVGLKFTFADET
ncbi:MAG: AgmX/PglI C-terminal domain-containing protein [Bradymonadaceae bacterium]